LLEPPNLDSMNRSQPGCRKRLPKSTLSYNSVFCFLWMLISHWIRLGLESCVIAYGEKWMVYFLKQTKDIMLLPTRKYGQAAQFDYVRRHHQPKYNMKEQKWIYSNGFLAARSHLNLQVHRAQWQTTAASASRQTANIV